MPPPLTPRDFRSLDKLRGRAAKAEEEIVAADVQLAAHTARLDALVREGAPKDDIRDLEKIIASLDRDRGKLRDEVSDIRDSVDEFHDRLPDPLAEAAIPNFRADTPVLMLPVRLETRYVDGGAELRIRVFPDQVHIDNHETELTEDEVAAGRFYWQTRWNAANAEAEAIAGKAAFAELAKGFRPRRAAWIAYAMTPRNVGSPPRVSDPVFPDPARRASAWSRAAFATLLPSRWVAVGYVDTPRTGLTEAFRVSGNLIPDRLNTGLDPRAQSTPAVDADGVALDLPLDDGLKWITDFAAAEAVGMALRVNGDHLAPAFRTRGRKLGSYTLARLVLYGTNPTLDGPAAAQRLESLLAAHVYADGLELLRSGTPTNNSEANGAGVDSSDAVAVATHDPMRAAPAQMPAGDMLARALGITVAPSHLDRVVGVDGTEQQTAAHMINALWSATLGQTLDQLFDPALTDDHIGTARDHAVAHVRPGGVLPAMRVGNQPYGILPVTASNLFKPAGQLEEKLAQTITAVRGVWERAEAQVPRLRRAGSTIAENMEALLQQGPMAASNSFRRVYGPIVAKNATIDAALSATQARTRGWILKSLGLTGHLRISGMTADKRQHRLGAPFVQSVLTDEHAPLQPNYLADIALDGRKSDGRAAIADRGNAASLLEVLASNAELYEIDRASAIVVHKERFRRDGIALPDRLALRIDELVAVDPPSFDARPSREQQVLLQSGADFDRLVLAERTGIKTVPNYVISQLFDTRGPDADAVERFKSVLESLDYLSKRPARELDRAVRGTLDCYSYRLDPWISSLANRRLQTFRDRPQSKGVHVGGYGWVENLKPDTRPDSEGYIHAPSLQQAQTAALLRAGHVAHRGEGNAFAIDLSSARVRTALGLLRGVAQGQPLTALLGYRFERNLRERDIHLAKFILPIRRLFPVNPPPGETILGSQEAIAARDVVDVVKLLDRRRLGGNWLQGIALVPSADERAKIDGVVADIDDMFDAVADLLLAEGVHQLVGGNLERASAALGGMDRQSRPVEPEVVKTPRTGRAFAQRVGTILTNTALEGGWADFPDDTRGDAEPYLNAWVTRLLGKPGRWSFGATLHLAGQPERQLQPVRLADIGWSPLSLVLLAEPGSNDRPSGLQQKLASLLSAQVNAEARAASAELHLQPEPGAGGDVGLAAFEALAAQIRTVITRHRPANALDIAPPGTEAPSGADPAIIKVRADAVDAAQAAAKAALDAEIGNAGATASSFRVALDLANSAGAREAVPVSDEIDLLFDQARQVSLRLGQGRDRAEKILQDFNDALATNDQRVDMHVQRLKAMLGDSFPVIPPFSIDVSLANEWTTSLGDQSALTGKAGAVLHGWMSRMAEVRPRLADLAGCLIASELTGAERPDLRVAQFPHRPGARWIGRPLDPATPDHVDLSLVLHAPDLDPANMPAVVAGFMSDDWTETIPAARETSAITFHYDAPASRPPQALLLAVHPDADATGWLPSQVLACVNEALDLAKIRCVRPQDLDVMGALLPLVYLPDSYTRDVPGVDFSKLRLKVEASMLPEIATVLGKA